MSVSVYATAARTACLGAVVLPVFVWDLRQHRIPNAITVAFLLISGLVAIALERPDAHVLPSRIAVGVLLPLLVRRLTCNGIGMGDVRLSAGIAVLLGVWTWGIALLLASILALVCLAIIGQETGSEAGVPFGPFLVTGALLVVIRT